MRTSSLICVSCLLTWVLAETAARADSVHLPCDKPIAGTIGTGSLTGKTGDIWFERIEPTFLQFEVTMFQNCGAYDPKRRRHKVTRHWFGGISLHGMITPETSSVGFEQEPVVAKDDEGNTIYQLDENGEPRLDSEGNMIPKTENTLLKAELSTGMDFSGGAGANVSIYDGDHFHIEAFFDITGTFGWNEAHADTVVAHALEIDLDVTRTVRQHAQVRYRHRMVQTGLKIGLPLRPAAVAGHQLTPFIMLGYMWFRADIDVKLDENISRDLEAVGVNVEEITKRRVISKQSPTASIGARLDFNKKASIETTAMFGYGSSTKAYVFTGSFTYRFDTPW